MKKTIVIEEPDEFTFEQKLDEVLNDYTHRVFSINTGAIHNGYDSRGFLEVHYYAIVIVEK